MPKRQRKQGRLWLNEGSCVRLRPQHPDHVWSYDFVATQTHDGRPLRMLTLIDEYTRECLAIDVARKLSAEDVLERLTELFILRGAPAYLLSEPHFRRLFVQQTGRPPHRLLARLRVFHALRLIEKRHIKAAAVAAEAGFGSVSGMYKQLHQHRAYEANQTRK